ncbi:YdbH domain-containing protein [Shewanella sairae]|uniref:YdbH domain-containing protein n=1 Tax=Shewanella sairae TaxID=190310 RepID=UPI001FE2C89B|nr:YdbH domain-containing protein [Shewanella sairae]MCL1131943.1 YdbH domain-containing protein [Shewanella sairae]
MQQAVPKSWRQKAARYLTISFISLVALVAIAGLVALRYYERVTIDVANQFLSAYNTQVHQLSFKPQSLTQWHVTSAELTIDNTDITLNDLNLVFDKNTKPWAFNVSDLKALSVEDVQVKLSLNALILSDKAPNETGRTIGLNFDALPDIKVKQTHITLKGIEDSALSLTLHDLSLNNSGELSSQIDVNHQRLLTLTAELDNKHWQAKSNIDLTLLQDFTRQLAASERALLRKSHKESSTQVQHSLLTPLYDLVQTLDDKNLILKATLDSQLALDLKTAQLTSTHHLHGLSLTLRDFADLTLQPVALVATTKSAKSPDSIEFAINGNIAQPVLTLAPLKLPVAFTTKTATKTTTPNKQDSQLTQIINKLNDKPFEAALLNLYQELKLNSHSAPQLLISLNQALTYQLATSSLLVPEIDIAIINSKIDAKLTLDALSYHMPASNQFTLASHWQFKAQHQQPISLNQLWPTLQELPYQVEIDGALLELSGDVSASKNQAELSYAVNVNPSSTQQTQGISISSQPLLLAKEAKAQSHSELLARIGHTQINIDSLLTYQYSQGGTHLTIPSVSYQLTNLAGELALKNNISAADETYKFVLNNADLALSEPLSLNLTTSLLNGKPPKSILSQILDHQLSNQFTLNLSQLSLDKTTYAHGNRVNSIKRKKHTKQKLLNFDTIELSQSLALNKRKLTSEEVWQINDLLFNSQHQLLTSAANFSPFTLVGDWQFNSEFAPILRFLSQTDSLPDALEIQGNAELNMHYQLSKNKSTQFALTFDPKVNDIKGSINLLPFEAGNMDTQCQFNWQQNQEHKRASQFNCDNVTLSLKAFNPGVLITDINAEAAVAFSSESKVAPLTDSEAQSGTESSQQNLALAQQLLGVKQASVNLTAKGDLLGGQLLIPQFEVNLNKPSSAYFVLQKIDLAELLALQPLTGVYADGIFDGVLPVSIEAGKASVSGGKLAARAPGGLIAIGNNPAVEQMRQSQPYLEFAFATLEHLDYTELSSTFDMTAAGDATLKVNVKGRSQGVERPIHFNYSQEENMIQLLRSLQIGDNLQNQIEKAVK